MRAPAVAGKFYPSREDETLDMIGRLFESSLGEIPDLNVEGKRRIRGAVVPHAGYVYSGPVAAHAYAAMAKDGFPETFVIIGPNHHALGAPVAVSTEDFLTPLGPMRIDRDIAESLNGIIVNDPLSHRYEHSIEVQIPFIQFFSE